MISSVNVTKTARNWGFGHIYWKILDGIVDQFPDICAEKKCQKNF